MFDKLTAIVERISTDLGFRKLMQRRPDVALASYHLSADEKGALKDMMGKDLQFSRPNGFWWQ